MHSLRVLEFQSVLERLQTHCETPQAAAKALELRPEFNSEAVWDALEDTLEAHKALADAAPPSLGGIRDVRQSVKHAQKGGLLGGEELSAVGGSMAAMRAMRSFLQVKRELYVRLWKLAQHLPDLRKLEDEIERCIEPNGDVRDAASTQLASLRQRKARESQRLMERVQSYTSGKTRELLSDPIFTVRDGRYVIPVKAENRGKIRGIVHDTSASGQTIFVEPEDVLQLGNALREIEAAERQEVQRILLSLSAQVGAHGEEVTSGLFYAGELDFLFAKARLAYAMKGSPPERLKGLPRIEIAGGRHPLLDAETAVPLELAVGQESSVLITGPNTGGKTVAIKTVGLFALMAQSGLFPPAISTRMSAFSQVWADIGDEQSLAQSLSTFSAHIKNIAEALKFLKPGAIVLLDEIGAGTDPAEGAALAKAIMLTIQAKGGCVLASTHYGELKAFAYQTQGFANAAMEFDTKTLRPTYKLRLGAPGASQALRIAERYGIPKEIIEGAKEGLTTQQQDVAQMLEGLEEAQKLARQAQSEADRRAAELRRAEELAARKLAEADEIRSTVHSKANQVIEDALREIRLEAAEIFEELKSAPRSDVELTRAREKLKGLQEVGRDIAREYVPKTAKPPPSQVLAKGMSVRVESLGQTGVLLEDPSGPQARVQLGLMKMTVNTSDLRPAAAPKPATIKSRPNIQLQRAMHGATEIHLRQKRAEDAGLELEKFLDDAVLAGVPSVRIVHGKGEGILRKVTRETLRKHPHVATYRDGEPAEGGQGVTVATFK